MADKKESKTQPTPVAKHMRASKEVTELPYMDSAIPGQALPKKSYGGNFVRPEDRVAQVSAQTPKQETESAPMGDIFRPDKSGNSNIHDR